jgi:hypothetical protein
MTRKVLSRLVGGGKVWACWHDELWTRRLPLLHDKRSALALGLQQQRKKIPNPGAGERPEADYTEVHQDHQRDVRLRFSVITGKGVEVLGKLRTIATGAQIANPIQGEPPKAKPRGRQHHGALIIEPRLPGRT